MNERSTRVASRMMSGAALIAVPLAGMQLYLKHQALPADSPVNPPGRFADATVEAIAKLRNVDARLVGYQEIESFPVGVAGPRALAIDSAGRIFIAGSQVIRVIGGDGVRNIALQAAPTCIAVAGDTIFVGSRDHVELYDLTGKRTAVWPALPQGALLTGIAAGLNEVYLADSGRSVVVRTDHTGKILNDIGKPDPARGIPGILLPSPHLNVALAEDGTIWLNNAGRHRMENYSPDGTLERFWGVYGIDVDGFVGCCNPSDFALLGDGSVVTVEKVIARVKHYLPDGRLKSFVALPLTFAAENSGVRVAAGSEGRVFVLDRGAGVIRGFSPVPGGVR